VEVRRRQYFPSKKGLFSPLLGVGGKGEKHDREFKRGEAVNSGGLRGTKSPFTLKGGGRVKI